MILDIHGKTWKRESLNVNKSRVLIDLPSENGMYILHLSTNEGEQYVKLIKD